MTPCALRMRVREFPHITNEKWMGENSRNCPLYF
jgi:hypothetical protein